MSLAPAISGNVAASVAIPGTCGEWVQGTLDGTRCLVSCAIDWYARTTVALDPAPVWKAPPAATKAALALRLALAACGAGAEGGSLSLANPLPLGRGYASSTADVVGTLYAAGEALGRPLSAQQVARLAVQVEPSDSTMFTAPALLAHCDAAFARPLPPLPPLSVVVLDPGGGVDTLAYNGEDHRAALRRLAPQHHAIFATFEDALAAGDPAGVAWAATQSALVHQAILPSELVTHAHDLAPRLGALGICRAHSGTLVGLICTPEAAPRVAAASSAAFPGVCIRVHRALGTRDEVR